MAQPDVEVGDQREERVGGSDEYDGRFLRQECEPQDRACRVQPCVRIPLPEAREAVQRQRRQEGQGSVEQELPRHDDVVRHHRHEQRGHQADPTPVQQRPKQVDEDDRREADDRRREPRHRVAALDVERQRQRRLDQQRVRPEDREERRERGVAGDRRSLPRVDGFIGVHPDRREAIQPHGGRDHDDQERSGPTDHATALMALGMVSVERHDEPWTVRGRGLP